MKLGDRLVVKAGTEVTLVDKDADRTPGVRDRKSAQRKMATNLKRLGELQYLMYAENKRSVLIVLQAMDAGGKDGTIRHVMGPLNPQGVRVTSFKAPSTEELSHDFLWRIHQEVPPRGMIGIFNRSHYEDVLIARVHDLVPKSVWSKRYEQINAFEKILAANDVTILKFFLHISKAEQLQRLEDRLQEPDKHWKANPKDFEERKFWDDYMHAYEIALEKCSTKRGPWYIIPSDRKWYRNFAVSEIIVEAMEDLKMKFPEPKFDVSEIEIS